MRKETMEKLDRLNLIWVLENLSVGNLVRGIAYFARVLGPVKENVKSTAKKIKTALEEEVQDEQKSKKSKNNAQNGDEHK